MLTDEQRNIVENHLKLVYCVVKMARSVIQACGLDEEDAIQAGFEAMCKVAEKWDPTRGAFSTIAFARIRSYIFKAANENGLMRVPISTQRIHPGMRKPTIVSLQAPLSLDGDNPQALEDLLLGDMDADHRAGLIDLWDRLTPYEYRVLSLVLDGNDQTYVANIMGKNPGAIYETMQRIRKKTTHYLAEAKIS